GVDTEASDTVNFDPKESDRYGPPPKRPRECLASFSSKLREAFAEAGLAEPSRKDVMEALEQYRTFWDTGTHADAHSRLPGLHVAGAGSACGCGWEGRDADDFGVLQGGGGVRRAHRAEDRSDRRSAGCGPDDRAWRGRGYSPHFRREETRSG